MNEASVLVVEDEPIIASNIARMLERMGYGVSGICHNSEAVLPAVLRLQPTVVLMDICIEGVEDGVSLAEKIREHHHIPVVYLSAMVDDETLQRAKITQPFGYVAKPFSQRELQITLEIALYKARTEARLARQELQIRHLIDNIHQGFCLASHQGRIWYANKQFGVLVGLSPRDLGGQEISRFLVLPRPGDNGRYRAWKNQEVVELDLRDIHGHVSRVAATAEFIPESLGEESGIFISLTDLESLIRKD